MVEINVFNIEKDDDETQVILGHATFIKTAEDLYEAMINATPSVKFGIAFAEASGPCLIRSEGNDHSLRRLAEANMASIRAGHTFIILFKNAYPINVIKDIKDVGEVVSIHCATANPLQVVVAKTEQGTGIIGVIDGNSSRGVETLDDKDSRRRLLRNTGYKK